MSRFRNAVFTLFTEDSEDKLLGTECRFIVFQQEICPTTRRKHYQGYVEFEKQVSMSSAKSVLGYDHIHIERRRGNQSQAIEYSTKEDTRCGGPFSSGVRRTQGTSKQVHAWLGDIKDGNFDMKDFIETDPQCYMQYRNVLKEYHVLTQKVRKWVPEVYVFIGKTGTGKTRKVYEDSPDIYVHPGGKWFDGYDGERDVLFDDFGPTYGISVTLLLRLLDRYPMTVEIKGGHINFAPRKIYMTSNLEIEEWWPFIDNCHIEAVNRRITEIERF